MRIYASKKQSNIVWQRGHRRISIDCTVYSSWVAARIKCGYKTDSTLADAMLRPRLEGFHGMSTRGECRKTLSNEQVLTGSFDQWAVKFRVSFGRPNWRTNVLETEA